MSNKGEHLICNKHEVETYYCDILKKWLCVKCELEVELF